MLLKDRVAVISGAASPRGIGRATARLFAEQGARVVILDLDEIASRAAAEELGSGHLGFACDVTNPESCRNAATKVLKATGKVDVLINNAGITQPAKFQDISTTDWQRIMAVNLDGVLYLSQAFVPHMRTRRRARSPACRRSRPSAAAAFSAARITRRPRRACSGWPRRWRANWVWTTSG